MKMAITAVKPSAVLLAFLIGYRLNRLRTDADRERRRRFRDPVHFYPRENPHLDLRAREGVNNNAKGASWRRWCVFIS